MRRGPIQCDGPVGVQTQLKLFVRAVTGWSHHAQAIGWQERLHKNAIPKIQIMFILGHLEKRPSDKDRFQVVSTGRYCLGWHMLRFGPDFA